MTAELHQLPTRLDRLEQQIRDDIERAKRGRQEWIEGTLALAQHLCEARAEFPRDPLYGAWLRDKRFDISKDDRAALLHFGKNLDKFREILIGETKELHPDTIWRKYKAVFGNSEDAKSSFGNSETTSNLSEKGIYKKFDSKVTSTKSVKRSTQPRLRADTKTAKAREWALRQFAENKNAECHEAIKALDIGETAARQGINQAKAIWAGRTEATAQAPLDISTLSTTAQQRLHIAIAHYKRQLAAEYEMRRIAEVRKHIDEYVLPEYGKKLAMADEILARWKPPFSNAEYRQLLAALHPDSEANRELRSMIFRLCKEREIKLRGIDEGTKLASSLPSTLEELMAMRKRRK